MANAITVTSWIDIDGKELSSASAIVINTGKIIGVKTNATPPFSGAVTAITYESPSGASKRVISLQVTETQATVLAAINAPLA